ncbi:hypothetical protein VIGAN_05247900 [Vigna angularis var. angularis]|uniref:Uncharacterized protein n=1 Tax=Vigna angularis var. angularis TaxID=157739 RepID=A0A0S3S7N4_PHAAN|nr:hypothetical protein VIGAN_05247900 [Vigna angularis var. angularis]
MNAIDYGLYKQAYEASLGVRGILDQYEISKLLKGPFDMARACLVIKASLDGIHPKRNRGRRGVNADNEEWQSSKGDDTFSVGNASGDTLG